MYMKISIVLLMLLNLRISYQTCHSNTIYIDICATTSGCGNRNLVVVTFENSFKQVEDVQLLSFFLHSSFSALDFTNSTLITISYSFFDNLYAYNIEILYLNGRYPDKRNKTPKF